jgi:outer membrane protein assembly factor BamB
MSKNKIAIAISLFLMFAIIISLFALPTANAQDTMATYAYIGALPNPVGVGQEVLLHIGITQQLARVQYGWEDLSVTIERPDGKIDKIENVRTDATGGTGRTYVPDIEGIYYLQTHFPEQENPATEGSIQAGTIMKASDSVKLTLVVQTEPLEYYPAHSLPTEFWTRPINAQHREWANISGSSYMSNEYNEAPESPHVLWTRPLSIGGLVGGDIGEHSFEHGDAYQGKFSSRVIIAGILIYMHDTNIRPRVYTAVDVRTGEVLWEKVLGNNLTLGTPQLFYWDSYNYNGTFAYLWCTSGSTWYSFDPLTGEPRYSMTNVPSGTTVYGEKGEIYRYTVNLNGGWMALWNSSALGSMRGSWSPSGGFGGNIYMQINASDGSSRAERAWAWNISIPDGLPGSVVGVNLGDKVVGVDMPSLATYRSDSLGVTEVTVWAFSLEQGREGTLLYKKTTKTPTWAEGNLSSRWRTTDFDSNVGLVWNKEELTYHAFDLKTGEYLWKTEVPQNYLDIYSTSPRIAYGKLYSVGQSGHLYCFDITDGKLKWIYNATDPYSEFLWGENWSEDLLFINEGKIYMFHSEHSPVNPLFRGAPAICVDAETGEEIWRVDGLFRKTDWGGGPIMGDSVIAMYNSYDQRVYAIGKGPSSTTVTAPEVGVEYGKAVMVKGTVTDVSPGTNDLKIATRFPNGVPAVSDESQGEWMKYVYAQFARPSDVKGVNLTISVIDPNTNAYEVATATSDASGCFACTFEPAVPGLYTVVATFEGSNSYYGSFAETFLNVEAAPEVTVEPTPTSESTADLYLVPGIGGIIAAIAVVGAILVLMLRKR